MFVIIICMDIEMLADIKIFLLTYRALI